MQSFMLPANGQATPKSIERKRKMAEAMLAQGVDYSPIASPWQGAARMANALVGGLGQRKADKQEAEGTASAREAMIKALNGGDNAAVMEAATNPFADSNSMAFLGKRWEQLNPEPLKPTSDIQNYQYGLENPGFAKQQMAGGDNDMYGTGYWDAKNKRYVFPSKSGQWVAPEGLEPGAELQDPATRAAAIAGGKLTGGAAEPVINEYVKNVRPAMQNASATIKTIHEARKIFDKGIATGNQAALEQSARGWAKAMGFEVDESVLSNTQAFQNFIGQMVIPRMKELGGNDSNEELRKLYELSGGDITNSGEAIKLTLNLTEKLMRDKLRMGREYERITTGILPMSPVEEPPEYVIENMASPGGPAAQLPQAMPDASDPLGLRPKR